MMMPISPLTPADQNEDLSHYIQEITARYDKAKSRRTSWERLWDDSYYYALPQRNGFSSASIDGQSQTSHIFDGTALDSTEKLAASLMGNLTPPWTQWFGLKPGPDLTPQESERLAPVLEKSARTIQAHMDRSNFLLEMHQCFLDLVVGGTAILLAEDAAPGQFSALKFTSVPLHEAVLEEGERGFLDGFYRKTEMTHAQIKARWPLASIPSRMEEEARRNPQAGFTILESILPHEISGYVHSVHLPDFNDAVLQFARIPSSPVIAFRWMKTPGEVYGRSPVMKALPDIRTANKVVELILKNASIAVTGIWQADDDGVLNPANIALTPGSIIPRAVGSRGLTPLEMPGRFDVSQLVLDDLRARIRHALLADTLAPITDRRMTATEVLERAADMALLLGATYGRLQTELLTPLITRCFTILRRRGEVPDISLDGRLVALDYRSPLARAQAQRNVSNTLSWITTVLSMGGEAADAIDLPAAARFLGEALGVPSDLIKTDNGRI